MAHNNSVNRRKSRYAVFAPVTSSVMPQGATIVSPERERKLLAESLKNLEGPVRSWSWPVSALMALAFAVLGFLAAWIFENLSSVGAWQIIALVCTFLAGAIIGAIGFWNSRCKKGALIRPYIDKARMRARLAELEA